MKKIEKILQDAPSIAALLKNHDYYWAHIHPARDPESLAEHGGLVNQNFMDLVKAHNLENVIDRLIQDHVRLWPENKEAANCLKTLFVHVIVFHDFGKINENFQALRMGNTSRFKPDSRSIIKPSYGHSFPGAFLFLAYHIDLITKANIQDKTKSLLVCHCFFLSYSILQHHSPVLKDASSDTFLTSFRETVQPLENYIKNYGLDVDKVMLNGIFENIEQIWSSELEKNEDIISFPLFALIKLNFSLLTAADYLATNEYMNSVPGNTIRQNIDLGVFNDRDRINTMLASLRSYKHNRETYSGIDNYSFTHPTERSNGNLNILRKEMAIELVQTVRKNTDKKLFYIEAPTGGGKTNLSIITATELLASNPELNKIFYVFPFTTLITQTFKLLKESLNLADSEIMETHSKAGLSSKSNEEKDDGLYGDDKKDYIDNLFMLFPITVLSHVRFFDILKTQKKDINYLLHRLANAVVVIDEIQSYNPAIWDKMLYFISRYSDYFNIRFVLMSATLPKISELNIGLSQKPDFIDLLPKARQYITNKNFSERVTFNFELFKGEITVEKLAGVVIDKSDKYADKNGSVRTIVEFIYKKTASAFLQEISAMKHSFNEIFILSGTILESRRREIINFIKRTSKLKINILLITTQVVEAGVDIDMDLGFKNISLIDSDEQLAGRVNRNALKEGCEVYLFRLDNARLLYGKDYRYQQTREHIDTASYQKILEEKDFKRLYETVITAIDRTNTPSFKDSLHNYEEDLCKLRFDQIDTGFKIIDQDTYSVFVPLKVPIEIKGSEEETIESIFSSRELDLLKQFSVTAVNESLDGEEVWKVYESMINRENQHRKNNDGFNIKSKIEFKAMQSILSKFTFSLLLHSRDYQNIRTTFGEEKFGYLYFSYWNTERTAGVPYSYTSGLNSKAFSDANFI